MVKAGIIGATGYAGEELCRILLGHPEAEIAAVSSVSFEGKPMSEVYPSLRGIFDGVLTDEDSAIAAGDVVFASLPHGLSEPLAEKCLSAGKSLSIWGRIFVWTTPLIIPGGTVWSTKNRSCTGSRSTACRSCTGSRSKGQPWWETRAATRRLSRWAVPRRCGRAL